MTGEELLKRIKEEAENKGFRMEKYIVSPIKGGDGNVEYLALFVRIQNENI